MEDGLARDGVLTRCNEDRDATANDVECANARRAAAAIALEAERARAAEQGSEATQLALRERDADGAPAVPSIRGSTFDVYANGSDALARPALEIEAAPPPNDLVIASPQIEITVPRPFRAAE